jgi:hypothetical protein
MDAGAFQIKNQPKHMNLFMTLPNYIGIKKIVFFTAICI